MGSQKIYFVYSVQNLTSCVLHIPSADIILMIKLRLAVSKVRLLYAVIWSKKRNSHKQKCGGGISHPTPNPLEAPLPLKPEFIVSSPGNSTS